MGQAPDADTSPRRCHRCGRTLIGPERCACIRIADETSPATDGDGRASDLAGLEAVAFGDWSADTSLSSDVRGQLARWRRIREGPWVRRRVLTGEAGPLGPDADEAPGEDAHPGEHDLAGAPDDARERGAGAVIAASAAPTGRPPAGRATAAVSGGAPGPAPLPTAAEAPTVDAFAPQEAADAAPCVVELGPPRRRRTPDAVEDTSEVIAISIDAEVGYDAAQIVPATRPPWGLVALLVLALLGGAAAVVWALAKWS